MSRLIDRSQSHCGPLMLCWSVCVAMTLASVSLGGVRGQDRRAVIALYADVLALLTEPRIRIGDTSVSVTFGIYGDDRELYVQFDPTRTDACEIDIRYVPSGQESVYNRLFVLAGQRPNVTPDVAARLLALTEEARTIQCASALGILLGQAGQHSIPIRSPVPPRALFIDGLTYRVSVTSPHFSVTSELPSALDIPVVIWLNSVRVEVLKLLANGAARR